MNWRPASPFDACLANELVRAGLRYDRWSTAAVVLGEGYNFTPRRIAWLLWGRKVKGRRVRTSDIDHVRELSDVGKEVMCAAAEYERSPRAVRCKTGCSHCYRR